MEVAWQRLLNLRISKKLAQICHQWGFHIRYFDATLREIQPSEESRSEACRWLEKRSGGKAAWDRWLREAARKASILRKIQVDLCPAGVTAMVAPLIHQGECLGFVLAEGVLQGPLSEEFLGEIHDLLKEQGVRSNGLEGILAKAPVLSEEKLEVFQGLLETMVEEMGSYLETVSSQEKQISPPSSRYDFSSMVGRSEPLLRIFDILEKIIPSDSTVLLLGESGTGKELIARIIHYNSPRKDKPFIAENCSAFSENLLESELFGHERGAFTGAVVQKKGLFELADGGTFLLDEIGDTSPALQTKLLRVLQDGTFKRVGGTKFIKVDVRIIAATNKDLKKMVEQGTFREDLYYRLNEIRITLPPLRERHGDIPLLCNYFLEKFCMERGIPLKQISEEAMKYLEQYSWPGNVRELQNEIKRATLLAGSDPIITKKLLSTNIIEEVDKKHLSRRPKHTGTLRSILEAVERDVIKEGLERTNYNKSKLARELGISRKNLILKVMKYDLEKPGRRGRR